MQAPGIAATDLGLLDFLRVMESGRHGEDQGLREVLPPMPWPAFGQLTARDLEAVHAYLRAVPPQPARPERSPTYRCDVAAPQNPCQGGASCVGGVCQGQACSVSDDCPVAQGCTGGTCVF